ncbi:acyl-CoA thioesterase [Hymenobacter sp. BT186]|uniref:Acyl-CoA thioesterase n=1 Tax=Hymenobacter telluris TaxID=2816474 RepID=A0A939ETI5_9BACT|nr:acyl-CoA thioesterase [Hymenobacter telluris]MBO0356869.1 acyl-CoA thioesterase [Hymenobacter telluris]MBW3372896.1 acyl-CoA thioesterase [Hymenobacter norwichensis]
MALLRTPETTHRVHFQDCDMLGHLNNARYLDYFLNAREEHTTRHYALNLGELSREQGAAWVITKHHISYLRPAVHAEVVLIRTQLIHFDNSNLVVEMQMLSEDGQRLKALLWSEMAFVSVKSATRSEHSDALMDMLEELDVEEVQYDADGFDERVKHLRKQLKQLRKE